MKIFTDHPADVGETYAQHMGVSMSFGFRMIIAGFGCILHGLFPFICTRTGSRMIERLNHEMCTHRDRRTRPDCPGTATRATETAPTGETA
ncbi:DUF6356 family protein [Algimonas porphyrae]|uniref:Capsule biosynthesis protein n=1 Tax=Algimonas porphyrae TaxID=1128113 RepID=A0ABQ5UX87_9PROT|nr:DUF6356 family protein [Algimonas porphyrae]GLQ19322.1 hypothetical protein GCM10007854_02770 [Algimonas porphyrae]